MSYDWFVFTAISGELAASIFRTVKENCREIMDFVQGKATNGALSSEPLRAAELSGIFYVFCYRKIFMFTDLCSNMLLCNVTLTPRLHGRSKRFFRGSL
jgi:hypothetical protein